ncbi:MAG: HlyD family efflux transporter periplasmic adaptor subunit [Oscillospiraceae bacterium]
MNNTAKNTSKKRIITIVITLIILIILVSLPFILQKDKLTYVNSAIPYNSNITKTLSYTGVLDSDNSQVISFSDRFFCEEVYVKQGQRVKKGDQLFKGYTMALTGTASASQILKADFDGIITTLNVSKGDTIVSQPLIILKDVTSPKVTLLINKYDREVLQLGQKATVKISGFSYDGEVSFIGNSFETFTSQNSSSSGIYAEIKLENKQGKEVKILSGDESAEDSILKNGPLLSDAFIANIQLDTEITTQTVENALCVPVSAFKSDKDGDYCFIIDVNNKAQKTYVTLGLSDDTNYEIKSGLTKNERVINNPPAKISSGDTVLEKTN